jgi:hypothetical protein
MKNSKMLSMPQLQYFSLPCLCPIMTKNSWECKISHRNVLFNVQSSSIIIFGVYREGWAKHTQLGWGNKKYIQNLRKSMFKAYSLLHVAR